MNLILLIFMALPQDYIDLVLKGEYDEAISYCEQKIEKGKKVYDWTLEKGDLYLAKTADFDKAVEVYKGLMEKRRKKDGWLYYRLALAYEMTEDFLSAAKAYEIVATKYRKFPIDSFALSGVERCFKKNYQDFVATINGYNITRLELDEEMSKRFGFGSRDEHSVLDGIILSRLIFEKSMNYRIDTTQFFYESMIDRRNSLLLEEVYAVEVIERAKPSEREMKKFYKNNKNYLLKAEIRGKEIVVESESLANFLLDSLKKHIESFDTLATVYSTVHSSKNKGNMGIVFKGVKPEPVDKILFKAKLNELIGVISFDEKYGIYMVTGYKPERYRDYEKVKSQIETQLKAEKLKEVEEKFIKKLRKKAKIKLYVGELSELVKSDDDPVVVVLNGREIRKSDVEERNESQPNFGKVDLTQPKEFEKLLNTIIEEDLKLEFGERNKYFLKDGYITKMQTALRQIMENGLYRKVVIEAAKVDSQEVTNSYNENRENFKVGETVHCQEIVVDNKAKADELKQLVIENPACMDSLAREHSIAPSKKRGGITGPIGKNIRSKKFESIVFKLKNGDISAVFKNNDGNYAFVKVVDYTPEGYKTLDELWTSIETNLLREKQRSKANSFIENIREGSKIEIFLAEPEPVEEPSFDESDQLKKKGVGTQD